jgi:hypothetical protein
MKVHLIRSEGFPVEDFNNVVNLLKLQRGPIEFVPSVPIVLPESEHERTYDTLDDFTKKDAQPMFSKSEKILDRIFPLTQRTWTWAQLFKVCTDFRKVNNIPTEDHIMLLTEKANDKNWFGCVDASMRNYFVHTSDWDLYFDNNADARFPVAYEILVWLMRSLMYNNQQEIIEHVHRSPRGCMMDFCEDKKQIVLKMRTADICPSCTAHISARDLKKTFLKQIFATMDGIRENLLFRQRSILLMEPSKLEIRGYRKDVFLTDLGDLQVNLNPKEKSIFLLYLNHSEGIKRSHLVDHVTELRSYYAMISSATSNEQIDENIQRLVDVTENNMAEVFSRIRNKFRTAIPDLWSNYAIQSVGETHKIVLNRELVTFID